MNGYLDGDTLAQCREALRQGKSLEDLAGRLRCDTSHLSRLLGLPVKPAASDEPDLWRTDELESQL